MYVCACVHVLVWGILCAFGVCITGVCLFKVHYVYCLLIYDPTCILPWLRTFNPALQGKGVGSRMIRTILSALKAKGGQVELAGNRCGLSP